LLLESLSIKTKLRGEIYNSLSRSAATLKTKIMDSKSDHWTDPTLLEKIGNLLYSDTKYFPDEKTLHQLRLVANDPYDKCRLSYLHFNEWFHDKFYKFWHDRQDFWLDLAEVFRFTSILVVLNIKNRETYEKSIIQTAANVCDLTINALVNVGFQNKIDQNDLSWRLPEIDEKVDRDFETSSDNSWSIIDGNRCSTGESHEEMLDSGKMDKKLASVVDIEKKVPEVIRSDELLSDYRLDNKLSGMQSGYNQEPYKLLLTAKDDIELDEIERENLRTETEKKYSEPIERSDESTKSSSNSSESENEHQYQHLEEEIELRNLAPSTVNEHQNNNVFTATLEKSTFEELATDIIESTLVKSYSHAVNNPPDNLVTVPEEIKRIDELEGENTKQKTEGDHELPIIQGIHTEIEMQNINKGQDQEDKKEEPILVEETNMDKNQPIMTTNAASTHELASLITAASSSNILGAHSTQHSFLTTELPEADSEITAIDTSGGLALNIEPETIDTIVEERHSSTDSYCSKKSSLGNETPPLEMFNSDMEAKETEKIEKNVSRSPLSSMSSRTANLIGIGALATGLAAVVYMKFK